MKIAIYGGSFNPVHNGHLTLAEEVALGLGYDKVLFVPTFIPPHKQFTATVSPTMRLEMLELAVKDNDKFEVEQCEIQRGGLSYTIDTVKYLAKKYADSLGGKLGLVIGQEIAAEFEKWKNPDEIAAFCDIIVGKRRNFSDCRSEYMNKPCGDYFGGVDENGDFMNVDSSFKWPYTGLQNFIVAVSSTELRDRIAAGKSWRYLVPPSVYEYIVSRRLYGCKQ